MIVGDNVVQCDICGKREDEFPKFPSGWGAGFGVHICPSCLLKGTSMLFTPAVLRAIEAESLPMYLFIRGMLRDNSIYLSKERKEFIRNLVVKFEPDFVEIRNCPLCGSNRCKFVYDDFTVWVKCEECGAFSGGYSSKEAAAVAWNFRTILLQTVEKLKHCPICGSEVGECSAEQIYCRQCGFSLLDGDYPAAQIYSMQERWNRRTNEKSFVSRGDFLDNLKYRVDTD